MRYSSSLYDQYYVRKIKAGLYYSITIEIVLCTYIVGGKGCLYTPLQKSQLIYIYRESKIEAWTSESPSQKEIMMSPSQSRYLCVIFRQDIVFREHHVLNLMASIIFFCQEKLSVQVSASRLLCQEVGKTGDSNFTRWWLISKLHVILIKWKFSHAQKRQISNLLSKLLSMIFFINRTKISFNKIFSIPGDIWTAKG